MDIVVDKNCSKDKLMLIDLATSDMPSYQIIYSDSLKNAVKYAKHEFICYIGPGIVSTNIFKSGMEVFKDTPSYRKLSMISCSTKEFGTNKRIYGYTIADTGVLPKYKRDSLRPYGTQVGYIGGSIMRTTSLAKVAHMLSGNMLRDSYMFSVDLWLTGNRCVINPQATYTDEYFAPEGKITFTEDPWADNATMISVRSSWYKEVIT